MAFPVIRTIDMHTCGEPLRIVVDGLPEIRGKTILEKRQYAREHLDHIRRFLMFEPRGHYDMYGCYLVKPDLEEADIAVLFTHNEGYSTMCGHAVLALARYAADYGYVKKSDPETCIRIQCPCGLVRAYVEYDQSTDKTGSAHFLSVPAFVTAHDVLVDVPGYGTGHSAAIPGSTGKVQLDVSFGGAFYALVDAAQINLDVTTASVEELKRAAAAIKSAVQSSVPITHPESPDLAFLYGVIITDGKDCWDANIPTANVTVFADGEVDRAPTGSGVTARMAAQYFKKQIGMKQRREFIQPLIKGSTFRAQVTKEVNFCGTPAVEVQVAGKAFYSGESTFRLEEGDAIGEGFLVR